MGLFVHVVGVEIGSTVLSLSGQHIMIVFNAQVAVPYWQMTPYHQSVQGARNTQRIGFHCIMVFIMSRP